MSTLPWSDTRSEGQTGVGPLTSVKSPTTPEGCLVLQLVDFVPWENPEDLVTADVENLVDRIKAAIVVPLVCIIGFPTNCLNMAVFYKQGLKERINTCLFILSFVDLLYLVFICILYGERAFALSPSSPRFGPAYRFAIENHFQGFYGIAWASAFVTTVIGSERCFCIYFPLRSQIVIQTKTMAIFLALSCLLITLGYYVVSEKYHMICIYDVERNVTVWQLTATSYYVQHQNLVDIFDNTVYGFCLPIFFNIIDISCTSAMFAKLKKTMSWRFKASSTISAKEAMLTKMLVCLSINVNILSAPDFFLRSAAMCVPDLSGTGKYFNTFMLMISVCEICSFLNASFPFFVYYFAGSKYRETLHNMLNCRRENSFVRFSQPYLQKKTINYPLQS